MHTKTSQVTYMCTVLFLYRPHYKMLIIIMTLFNDLTAMSSVQFCDLITDQIEKCVNITFLQTYECYAFIRYYWM